jgi:hypothetical protein
MTARKLLPLLVTSVLLSACATSQLRIVPKPTEAPVQPTIIVGSEYPTPISNNVSSKNLPYPEQGAMPVDQSEYPAPLQGTLDKPAPQDTPAPGIEPSWDPQPGDDKLQRGNVYIDSQQILTLESFPPQFMLALKGNLPTPCHKLRIIVNPPDSNQQIQVEVYSLVNPDEICIQMLEPFQASVTLKDLPAGTYEVLVNQQPAGTLTVP